MKNDVESQGKIWLGVMVVLVNEKAQVLMGVRKGAFGEGAYGIPGGHIEEGERVQDAVIRELCEEIGIQIDERDLQLLAVTNYIISEWERRYITFDFLINKWVGEIAAMEESKCDRWEWASPRELPQNIHLPAKKAIEHYLNWIKTKNVLID